MASKYWIKLYHEILHDRKMARLPDHLWRRTIELFLMAGVEDNAGELPPFEDIAWDLRIPEDQLKNELNELEKLNILTYTGEKWVVTNFASRQAPVKADERMRQYRKRQREGKTATKEVEPNSAPPTDSLDMDIRNVTKGVTKRNIESDTESDINTTTKGQAILDKIGDLCKDNFTDPATCKPFKADLMEQINLYSAAEVLDAINLTLTDRANGQAKGWGYVKAVLKGRAEDKKKGHQNGKSSNYQSKQRANGQAARVGRGRTPANPNSGHRGGPGRKRGDDAGAAILPQPTQRDADRQRVIRAFAKAG
jgi:hypothetical protein